LDIEEEFDLLEAAMGNWYNSLVGFENCCGEVAYFIREENAVTDLEDSFDLGYS
jgi:hypothetical protein